MHHYGALLKDWLFQNGAQTRQQLSSGKKKARHIGRALRDAAADQTL